MSSSVNYFAPRAENLREFLKTKKLFVVGAGGIGCELLKNLVLTGFTDIHVIDLDTIDVSNLNRQFLFQRQHVGQPKAKVAAEAVMSFCPEAKITFYHDSVFNRDYNVNFMKQFDLVLNALDNRAARVHMNRLCLAAAVPLVESGSAGYLGQVSVISKGVTECYECTPKPTQRTYPGCTIRNTPSEPIHCIVWAKHLFNQLFGEPDIDEDVSPDVADPELQGDNAQNGVADNATQNGAMQNGSAATTVTGDDKERVSTRKWAVDSDYDPKTLFDKLFHNDVEYLLTMKTLWKKRRPPTPLDWENMPDQNPTSSIPSSDKRTPGIRDQSMWTPLKCRQVFDDAVQLLRSRVKHQPDKPLIWDKDDDETMDFVAAVANLRSYIFGIPMKTRFDIKSMAGNIVPAIATTNAMVAGMIVVEALKLVHGAHDKCRSVFITRQPNPRGKILVDQIPEKPNANCFACAERAEVNVRLNCETVTIHCFEEKLLKKTLNMVAPDVSVHDNTGTIIISSEPGETDALASKTLADLKIGDGTHLLCDDFELKMEFDLVIIHSTTPLEDNAEFEVVTENLAKFAEDAAKNNEEPTAAKDAEQAINVKKRKLDGDMDEPVSKRKAVDEKDDDDAEIVLA